MSVNECLNSFIQLSR
jgi:hypothetical protein